MAQPACLSALTMPAQIPLHPPLPKGEKAGPVSSPFLSPAGLDGRFAPLARCGNRNRASRHPCDKGCATLVTRAYLRVCQGSQDTPAHKDRGLGPPPQSIRRLDRMDLELIG